jgi:hypothetical protein
MRPKQLAVIASWTLAGWLAWFTADLIFRAANVTSRQWLYLMSIPGHQWTWAGVFGTAAALTTAGLVTRRRRITAAGCAVMTFGCGLIAVFYLVAPWVADPSLVTLGYAPWMMCAFIAALATVIYWKPSGWF